MSKGNGTLIEFVLESFGDTFKERGISLIPWGNPVLSGTKGANTRITDEARKKSKRIDMYFIRSDKTERHKRVLVQVWVTDDNEPKVLRHSGSVHASGKPIWDVTFGQKA